MNASRVGSVPDLSIPQPPTSSEDTSLEGIATNVKLLLKLLNDHQEASQKPFDPRQGQRLAGMISILDDVKARIHKSQMSGKKRQAELRRCNTDLRGNKPMGKNPEEPTLDDKEKLMRDLNMSFAAQKRLGVMCSSLGKEKQIIARELSRKVQELKGMEELLNDYKAQNEMLAEKIQVCRLKHKGESEGGEGEQEPNESMENKLRDVEEENARIKAKLEEMKREVGSGNGMVLGLKERLVAESSGSVDIEAAVEGLKKLFEDMETKLSE